MSFWVIGKTWLGGGLTRKRIFDHSFGEIISPENLLSAWAEFLLRKRDKFDVQEFALALMDNILELHDDLAKRIYRHGSYRAFNISDPKPRNIHKAIVRDRLFHHAIYRVLYPFFDNTFISDSYSCRINKGTHRAMNQFRNFGWHVSRNHTRTCWVLKCDIRKFFASIDQNILIEILESYIPDEDIIWILRTVIGSFPAGLPLGNLTSQLLVNIYMNEFDQHVKHKLRAKYYIRYADDFVFLSRDRDWLQELLPRVDAFLTERLHLTLHPSKVSIKTFASGIDFLGWVHFSDHRVIRTVTKRRVIKEFKNGSPHAIASYRGLLKHGNAKKLLF